MKRYPHTIILLSLMAAIACTGTKKLSQISADSIRVYPSPPAQPRIQYLTTISSSQDIVRPKSGFYEFVMGKEEVVPVSKPYGMALGGNKLYVCDLDIDGLRVIDFATQSFQSFTPAGLGTLQTPVNCHFDNEKGHLYVADSERRQVVVFDSSLRYINSLSADSSFRPVDVGVAGNKVFVSNSRGSAIYVFDAVTYELLDHFPKVKKGEEGFLYLPMNLNVTADKLYVTDFGEFVVKVYSHGGEYLGSIGSFGRNIGQFVRPKGIAVDREGNVFVVDAAFENVQIFNDQGQVLMYFGGPYKQAGDMWLPAKVLIDYEHTDHFRQYVYEGFELHYLILVSNMFGQDKINLYGFVSEKL